MSIQGPRDQKFTDHAAHVVSIGANTAGTSAKNRCATAVGLDAEEITWNTGDDITQVTVIACYTPGLDPATVADVETNFCAVIFDASEVQADAVLGDVTALDLPESKTGTNNSYLIPLNIPMTFFFDSPLSYNNTGNMWVKGYDAASTLTVWVGAF